MTLILNICATTTDEELERLIPYLDMRQEATERRNDARAVLAECGDGTVLELHKVDGVDVLFSPEFGYALVNERSPGVGNSLVIDNNDAHSAEHAASIWNNESLCTD